MAKDGKRYLKGHIRRVLEMIEPDLLPDETSQLVDEIESSLAAYALQAEKDKKGKKANDDLKSHRQKTLKQSIAIALSTMRNAIERQSVESRAEKRLRGHISKVLTAAKIGLTEDEKSRIEDRMIRLLDDYSRASDEDRNAVYKRGEEEVFSILDPPAKSFGASGNW